MCAMHLSRLGAELVLWSSEEFGFLELGDSFTSGSSLMPQKKNPDAAELLRAKAPRVTAHLSALLGVMHALPLAYNKDMQEDKEHLFDAVDTVNLCLEAAAGMLRTATFDRERLAGAASDEFLAATDIADLLVRRGVPFRESHAVVGGVVRHAIEHGKRLSELTREELAGALRQVRRRVLRGALEWLVAGVEGVRRRHRVEPGARAARTGQRGSQRGAALEGLWAMAKREARMISLGYGKFVKADRVYALVPIESDERGDGRRTYVHVDGLDQPIVASRSERAILMDVEAALTEAAGVPARRRRAGTKEPPPTDPRLREPWRGPRSYSW